MLLKNIVYVVEKVSIFARTTSDVHAVVNCYAPTNIQPYDTPSFRYLGVCKVICVMYFLDFLAKHLAYLYYFTFLRIIILLLLSIFRYLCKRRINN